MKCLAQGLTQSKHLIQGIIFVILDVTDFLVKKQQSLNTGANKKKLLMTSKFMNYNRRGWGHLPPGQRSRSVSKMPIVWIIDLGDSTLSQ